MRSTTTLVGMHQRGRHGSAQPRATGDRQTSHASRMLNARDVPRTALTWRWWIMTMAAFIIAGWTFYFVYTQPPGMDGYKEIRARILGNFLGAAHVGGGGIAMALGPFQFLGSLRRTGKSHRASSRFSAHSWLGRIYTTAVLFSGVGSLDIVRKSDLHTFGAVGFVALGSIWTITALMGWAAMWKNACDIDSHQKWMTRNFALTYAAVMLRWQFPLLIALGMDVKLALSWTGWSSWVPNLFFVDNYVLRRGGRARGE